MKGEVIELFDAAGRPVTPTSAAETERIRAVKQAVLGDVSCVLARANGADIDPRQAFTAARNLCEILFTHPERPYAEIPKLFWETPLGRAVGICCGDQEQGEETPEPLVKTTIHLPQSVREKMRLEAEMSGRSLSDLIAERLIR